MGFNENGVLVMHILYRCKYISICKKSDDTHTQAKKTSNYSIILVVVLVGVVAHLPSAIRFPIIELMEYKYVC